MRAKTVSLRTSKTTGQPRVIASGDHVAREDDWTEAKETAETKRAKSREDVHDILPCKTADDAVVDSQRSA